MASHLLGRSRSRGLTAIHSCPWCRQTRPKTRSPSHKKLNQTTACLLSRQHEPSHQTSRTDTYSASFKRPPQSASRNRPTSTSHPIEPIAGQQAVRNAAHLRPIFDRPLTIEDITPSSPSDDEVQNIRREALFSYKGNDTWRNDREKVARQQQLNDRQLQVTHQRLIDELEQAIDVPVDAPIIEVAATGASLTIHDDSVLRDEGIAISLAGLSIVTPTSSSGANDIGGPATPYAYLFSPSVSAVWCPVGHTIIVKPDLHQRSDIAVHQITTSASTTHALSAMSPSSPHLDDLLSLQPCAQDTSWQYVVEVLQPDTSATIPPICIRIRRAPQEKAPMLIDNPATTTEENEDIITPL
ncbi:hypothetical protein QAD02_017712 [Eretmocerus hayati]|uniref:Uncharacterized protein n=1 Tax=Eretmocerus hayati TaxID=131215 RepID=A0ACC2PEN8_9HYME|nr:hypothetical protein QAD02_017712 [Eretmocerus hayati]